MGPRAMQDFIDLYRAQQGRDLKPESNCSISLVREARAAQTSCSCLPEEIPVVVIAPRTVDAELGKRSDLRIELASSVAAMDRGR